MNAKRTVLAAGLSALALVTTSACSSSSSTVPPAGAGASTPATSAAATSASASASESMSASASAGGDMMKPFGAACAKVPATGPGSFTGMAADPVATAASHNPLLSTLVTAVGVAGLGDTLNSAKDITVFAPTNDAFGKIPADALKKILADKATLTKILTHHVIGKKLTPADLATGGPFTTLAGDTIMVKGSGEDFSVGGDSAKVLCGNVQTGNATVYIIDSVLTPGK